MDEADDVAADLFAAGGGDYHEPTLRRALLPRRLAGMEVRSSPPVVTALARSIYDPARPPVAAVAPGGAVTAPVRRVKGHAQHGPAHSLRYCSIHLVSERICAASPEATMTPWSST
jgi:hypothetical protein